MLAAAPSDKPLTRALVFTIFIHALAMLTMAAFLLPGMPGGPNLAVANRATYVATHPILWRVGWLGWQLTALSDLLLAIALVLTDWIPKKPARIVLVATLLTLIPDQFGQAMWTWHGVHLAQKNSLDYANFESHAFRLIAGYGTIGYLAAALAWTWCFAAAGTWNRSLTRLSIATWGLFSLSTLIIFLPAKSRPPAYITSAGNAIAFILLMIWLCVVTELVLRRDRPTTALGQRAAWRFPSTSLFAKILNLLSNSRLVRYIGQHLHAFAMTSDMTDVVYINYLVPAAQLEALVPPGLLLQRVGPAKDHAVFSILTYRHGHFGPHCLGPIRQFWPNPIQSNWRIYVTNPNTNQPGVFFTTTVITSTPHALATRILCEGVPMHVPRCADLHYNKDHSLHITIDPGTGSAPDLRGEFQNTNMRDLAEPWKQVFGSWDEMLHYCVPQDRAMAPQPWYGRIARQEISLGIPLIDCLTLEGKVHSLAANAIVQNAVPVCFIVERVHFRFLNQEFD